MRTGSCAHRICSRPRRARPLTGAASTWAIALLVVTATTVCAGERPGPSYTIDVSLDAAHAALHGHERLQVWNGSGRPLDHLDLHLYANAYRDNRTTFARDRTRLAVYEDPRTAIPSAESAGSISVSAACIAGLAVRFTVDGTVLRIPLEVPLRAGERVVVEIDFDVRIPRYRDRLAVSGGNFVIGAWFPKLAVLDDRGWNSGQRRGLGEFYSEAGDYDVSITVPAGFVVGATGARVDRIDNGNGTETSRWLARRVRDFAWVADRRYVTSETTWQDVIVRYLALPGHERTSATGLRVAVAALAYFSERYGRYPYRDFTVAEASAVEAGVGIEYPQMILISADIVASAGFLSDYEGVLVHETAHQWWYGIVGNDEVEEAWLDEALATYSTRRYLRSKYGSEPPMFRWPTLLRFLPSPTAADVARFMYASQARAGFDRPVRQSAVDFDDRQSYTVSVYYKGASVLDMLEYVVGTDTFDEVLRAYFERYAYDNARSEDFIRTAERVSGRDLTTFFAQWLDGTQTCDYSVDGLEVRQESTGYESTIHLHRRGAIVMPVVVRVSFDGGRSEDLTWDGRGEESKMRVRSPTPARAARLDPDRRLLETDLENNAFPRRRVLSLNPLSMPADAYALSWLPLAWYDSGLEVGGGIVFGGPPEFGLPYGMRRKHEVWMFGLHNVERRTTNFHFSYWTPTDAIGPRGLAGATLATEPGENRAGLHLRWFVGPHFYQAPTHTIEISGLHERQAADSAADPDRRPFDVGTVRSVRARYVFNALMTDYCPLRGSFVDGAVEVGTPALGSDWRFARATVRTETYLPVTSRSKLALSAFLGSVFGDAPRQRTMSLTRDGGFAWDRLKPIYGRHLAAMNAEIRIPIGELPLAGAAFVGLARYWKSTDTSRQRVISEAGIGLRLFDNAPFAVQIDWPLWVDSPVAGRRLESRRLVVRAGPVFGRNQ